MVSVFLTDPMNGLYMNYNTGDNSHITKFYWNDHQGVLIYLYVYKKVLKTHQENEPL